MQIWTNLKLYHYISNISRLLQQFHFPTEVVVNSFQTQKCLELVFRPHFFVGFFDEIISFGILQKLAKFH